MLFKVFKLKDTIDVFIEKKENQDRVLLSFVRMTTRERVEIHVSQDVAELVASFNGRDSTADILATQGDYQPEMALKLIEFLQEKHLIEEVSTAEDDPRYTRQTAFFDDWILSQSGQESQAALENQKVVVLGCGAVSAAIAEMLCRAGVRRFVLVDDKKVHAGCLSRQLFAMPKDIGRSKVIVLADYLSEINYLSDIVTFNERLYPTTNLQRWIDDDVDLVINSCDEPYIGHTSLKVGRFLHSKNIPLYVAGGFDAHLMSSGELVYPPHTPCIDCIQQTFTTALRDWKPIYSYIDTTEAIVQSEQLSRSTVPVQYMVGGAGGLAMMSSFSAAIGCLKLILFLADKVHYPYHTARYEYLPNHQHSTENPLSHDGVLTHFKIHKQEGCRVCEC